MPSGTVVRPVVESRLLRGNPLGDPSDRVTPVYLPPSYDSEGSRRYPVLYVLTGFTGTGRMLLNEQFLDESLDQRLDRLIATAAMGEAIVVMPDCMTRYGGSQYIDSAATGPYARYLVEELVPWVDASFRSIPSRDARGVLGKSSGGYGAIRVAMDHPETFGAFACHSGDMAFEYCYLADLGKALRYLWKNDLTPKRFLDTFRSRRDRGHDFFAALSSFAYAACYTPNPDVEHGFDLPVDLGSGEIVADVWQRWLDQDPVRMIPRNGDALRSQRLAFLDCGTKDEFLLDLGARRAASLLEQMGVEVVYQEFDDGHMNISYRYDASLPLLTQALEPPGP